MERLTKLLKSLTKISVITALVLGTYISFQAFVKYPFTQSVGPQSETKIVTQEKEVPASFQQTTPATKETAGTATGSIGFATNSIMIDPSPRILPMPAKSKIKQEVIILGKKNTLLFRGVVNMLSVAKMQAEILKMSAKLSPNTPIYLVLDTPGGSVEAGEILIDTFRALPNPVHTITLFSASMGFQIVENLDDRLILPSGTIMSHRMSVGGISGQVPGEAVTALNYSIRLAERMDKKAAKRLGMTFEAYRLAVRDELWLDGQDAVDMNLADREVLASCGSDLQGSYKEDINLLFFTLSVTWSECPLIRFPIAAEMKNPNKDLGSFTAVKKVEYAEFIHALLYDRAEFVHKYIITDKYKQFMVQ